MLFCSLVFSLSSEMTATGRTSISLLPKPFSSFDLLSSSTSTYLVSSTVPNILGKCDINSRFLCFSFSISRLFPWKCNSYNSFILIFTAKLNAIHPNKVAELPQKQRRRNYTANITNEKAIVNRTRKKFICRKEKKMRIA